MAVHARPAAFDGVDGYSYSVDILTDQTGNPSAPVGGYLVFLKWSHGEPQVAGHIETGFLVTGSSDAVVRHQIGAMTLSIVKATLDGLIRTATPSLPDIPDRPWWEVAATEDSDTNESDGTPETGA